jgi:DNA-binding transcriptional ArsR family regulator
LALGLSSVERAGVWRTCAPVFGALGDETRLSLVAKLCERSPQSIARLTEGSALTRQAISKHLRVLQNAGIVEGVRAGRESQYKFKPKPIDGVKSYVDQVSMQWDAALVRLKTLVEDLAIAYWIAGQDWNRRRAGANTTIKSA